jgi:hypothetical protein
MKYLTQIITEVRQIPVWEHHKRSAPFKVPSYELNTEKCHASIPSLKQIGINSGGYLAKLTTLNSVNQVHGIGDKNLTVETTNIPANLKEIKVADLIAEMKKTSLAELTAARNSNNV